MGFAKGLAFGDIASQHNDLRRVVGRRAVRVVEAEVRESKPFVAANVRVPFGALELDDAAVFEDYIVLQVWRDMEPIDDA